MDTTYGSDDEGNVRPRDCSYYLVWWIGMLVVGIILIIVSLVCFGLCLFYQTKLNELERRQPGYGKALPRMPIDERDLPPEQVLRNIAHQDDAEEFAVRW